MRATCLPCATGTHDPCVPGCQCCGRRALLRAVTTSESMPGGPLDGLVVVLLAAPGAAVVLIAVWLQAPRRVAVVVSLIELAVFVAGFLFSRRRRAPVRRRRARRSRLRAWSAVAPAAGSQPVVPGPAVATRRRAPHHRT